MPRRSRGTWAAVQPGREKPAYPPAARNFRVAAADPPGRRIHPGPGRAATPGANLGPAWKNVAWRTLTQTRGETKQKWRLLAPGFSEVERVAWILRSLEQRPHGRCPNATGRLRLHSEGRAAGTTRSTFSARPPRPPP